MSPAGKKGIHLRPSRARDAVGAPGEPRTVTDPAAHADLSELVAERQIMICSGSGGVGKTTTAAVLAMEAARAGRRAVVVTIDPAKRLADALGLEGIGNVPSRIEGPWPGELWAVMLDTKRTFDDLVTRYSAEPGQAERILANRFYKNISGALSGTQEYMAMEKLYDLHTDEGFDLVVVDTPPSRNALDFLEAPRRLTRFLDHRLYRVLMAPTRGVMKAVNVAAQAFVRSVSKVVGGEVFDDAVAFFQAFDGMEQGFKERAKLVLDLLISPSTAFVLVASPSRDTVAEARYFADKLAEAAIPVAALVVNRMHPHFTDALPEALRARAETLAGTELGGLYRNLADFALVAGREEEHLAGLSEQVAPAPVIRVPFLRSDVHDLTGLGLVGDHLFGRTGRG
ncbi:MAG: putative anion transporting ATPase [Acidimicrobiales bacterium]|nr:putative anion transporting ATPase [Acidimicrobiales bacterium]